MASVGTRTYLPGWTGTTSLNGVEYPIQGWSSSGDPGAWDATNELSLGWMYQEAGVQKVSFSFTMLCKIAGGLPQFHQGDTIPATFSINAVAAYSGNIFINGIDTKNDLKGGVTFDVKADSQGPMTGTMAPINTVPAAS